RRGSPAFTVGFNRDEQRDRPRGDGVRVCSTGRGTALLPWDPVGCGTWIAATDAGIVLALLNRNEPGLPDGRAPGRSRGAIILELLDCRSIESLAQGAEAVARTITRGFRLVATDGARVLDVVGGRSAGEAWLGPLERPIVRSSSGLGDQLVIGPRQQLFESVVGCAPRERWSSAQRLFHSHAWSDQTHLSVLMDRDAARTVSQTFVLVGDGRVAGEHAARLDGSDGCGFETASSHAMPLR
ncbi:MAG: NRDE family protein, partial [Phycisphaerales bacterium]